MKFSGEFPIFLTKNLFLLIFLEFQSLSDIIYGKSDNIVLSKNIIDKKELVIKVYLIFHFITTFGKHEESFNN